jgi:hypothetical protein
VKGLRKLTKAAGKVAAKRAAAGRAAMPAISIVWVDPAGVTHPMNEPTSAKSPSRGLEPTSADAAVRFHLAAPGSSVPPGWLADEISHPVVVTRDQPVQRGQRMRRPSPEQQDAALEILRERAREGAYVGDLPASEQEIRAESQRRLAEQSDAAVIRQLGRERPAAPESRGRQRSGILARLFPS